MQITKIQIAAFLILSGCATDKNNTKIKNNGVRAVIARLLGNEKASRFSLRIDTTFHPKRASYNVRKEGDQIVVEGNTPVASLAG